LGLPDRPGAAAHKIQFDHPAFHRVGRRYGSGQGQGHAARSEIKRLLPALKVMAYPLVELALVFDEVDKPSRLQARQGTFSRGRIGLGLTRTEQKQKHTDDKDRLN
jgi:hypothetical protein